MFKDNEKILLEYEKIRLKNEKERDLRVEKINKDFPRIKEIQMEMNKVTYQYIIQNAINPSNKESIEDLKKEIEKLETEKEKILKTNNIDKKEFEVHYNCENCKDTAFYIENGKSKECYCFKQKQINEKYKTSNINTVNKNTLENFDLNYFEDTVENNEGINLREKAKKLLEYLYYYIENFEEVRSFEKPCVIITGKTGTGKTHLIEAVGNEIIAKNHTVLFNTSSIIFNKLVEYRFGDTKKYNEMVDYLNQVDLLIIDDLGTEYLNEIKLEEIYTLINTRLYNNKPILFSTNLTPIEIGKKYNDRITSRILSKSRIFKLDGEDIRISKARKSK